MIDFTESRAPLQISLFSERSLRFEMVDAIYNGRLQMIPSLRNVETEHSFCVPRVYAPMSNNVSAAMCPRLPVPFRVRVRVLFRVGAKNPSSSLEIFGLFFPPVFLL